LLDSPVKKLIENNRFKDKISVERVNENSYKMKLLDTAEIYNKDLIEYYVNFEKLKRICENHGLQFEQAKPFIDMYKLYQKDKKNKKNLLRDYELAVTGLNTTFVFKKL
jgi:hypothetical protein